MPSYTLLLLFFPSSKAFARFHEAEFSCLSQGPDPEAFFCVDPVSVPSFPHPSVRKHRCQVFEMASSAHETPAQTAPSSHEPVLPLKGQEEKASRAR